MTTDNLIEKAKFTKIPKPLYLPRHLAVKRAQELKAQQEKKKTVPSYEGIDKKVQEAKLTPEEKQTMERMEKEAKVFKDYRVGDLRSRLPKPTGWRILVMPYRRNKGTI